MADILTEILAGAANGLTQSANIKLQKYKASYEEIIKQTQILIDNIKTVEELKKLRKAVKGRFTPPTWTFISNDNKYRVYTYYCASSGSLGIISEITITNLDSASIYTYKAVFVRQYKKAATQMVDNAISLLEKK